MKAWSCTATAYMWNDETQEGEQYRSVGICCYSTEKEACDAARAELKNQMSWYFGYN